jgi:catechol 2,3-dioxygenase-like lactoylglutathione lyase family enzyme
MAPLPDPSVGALGAGLDLGPIDQVSFVVRDLDASLPAFTALFGPFRVVEGSGVRTWLRGREVDPSYRLAFGMSGDMEIELVEIREGETVHTEHLVRHGEGIQHVRWKVDDVDATRERMEAAGLTTVFWGEGPGVKFAYLEMPETLGYTMFEIVRYDR